MRKRRPLPLRKGDVVAIVAPAGPVDPARLSRGIARLSAAGYFVMLATFLGVSLLLRSSHSF